MYLRPENTFISEALAIAHIGYISPDFFLLLSGTFGGLAPPPPIAKSWLR